MPSGRQRGIEAAKKPPCDHPSSVLIIVTIAACKKFHETLEHSDHASAQSNEPTIATYHDRKHVPLKDV